MTGGKQRKETSGAAFETTNSIFLRNSDAPDWSAIRLGCNAVENGKRRLFICEIQAIETFFRAPRSLQPGRIALQSLTNF